MALFSESIVARLDLDNSDRVVSCGTEDEGCVGKVLLGIRGPGVEYI